MTNITFVSASTAPQLSPDPARELPPWLKAVQQTWVRIWPPAITAGGFLGFWYIASYYVIPSASSFILPPPHEVVNGGIFTWNNFEKILKGLEATTKVTVTGLAIAILLGVFLAVLMSQARWIDRTLFPYAVALQAVPIVAIVPILILWWGSGFQSKVVVTIIISIFPVISNTLFGLRSADERLHDIFTMNDASRLRRLIKLSFPAALPAFFAGLRISAGLGVVGAVVGEFFFRQGTVAGLGRLVSEEFNLGSGQGPQLYTAIVFCCVLGLVLFWFAGLAGRLTTRRWQIN